MYKLKIVALSTITALFLFSFTTLPTRFDDVSPFACIKITGAKVSFKTDTHDFGEIPQGKPVSVEFAFTNDGNESFVISDVVTSCGCTAPDYPKAPIAAGASSKITVTYNAANKGAFSKTINVKSNDLETAKILTIKGTVK